MRTTLAEHTEHASVTRLTLGPRASDAYATLTAPASNKECAVAADTTFNAAVVLDTQVMAASSQFACTIAPAMESVKMAGVFAMRAGVDRVVFKKRAQISATVAAYAIMANASAALHGRAHHARLRVSHV